MENRIPLRIRHRIWMADYFVPLVYGFACVIGILVVATLFLLLAATTLLNGFAHDDARHVIGFATAFLGEAAIGLLVCEKLFDLTVSSGIRIQKRLDAAIADL